jgi:ketosteroid isomerase-like protein
MRRFLAFMLLVAAGLYPNGCDRAKNQARVEDSPQTQQMITALRAAYAAFNRGDLDAALEPFDAQIEWSEPPEFGGGTSHGRDGVKQYLTQSRSAWLEGSSEPEQLIPVGTRIVVFVHARFRPKGSDSWRDVRLADVYTVRDGKAIEMRAFTDRQAALR